MKVGNLAATTLLAIGGALLVTACSSTPGPVAPPEPPPAPSAAGSGGGNTCEAIQNKARAEIQPALDAARACAKDDDCTTLGFGASCFDSCSRAVAKAHVGDVEAASKKASAGVCQGFTAQGCKLIAPPCAPPQTPHCTAGLCT